jgi:hypothetical protein
MKSTFQNRCLDRRTVLRGIGACVSLPFLDAMERAVPARGVAAPRRTLFVFAPNGKKMDEWRPKSEGALKQLPFLLEPLAPVRDHIAVISGLALNGGRAQGDGPGDHARAAASFLTCAHPRKTGGADLEAGVSVDQLLASEIGAATRFPSLELGMERGAAAGICDSGYSCAYSNNVSWRSKDTPVAKETEPRAVFARMFGDPEAAMDQRARAALLASRRSVLDASLAEAKSLARQLGGRDRAKLAAYLDSVRELERRIEREQQTQQDAPPAPKNVFAERGDFAARLDAMYELIALAFETDQTRVATFMLGNAGSNRSYRFLSVPEGHHDLSHHGNDPHKLAGIRAINRFHVERFAAFLQRLQSTKSGSGTLLDATAVVYASGISDGDRHNHDDLPVLAVGVGRGGRHVVCDKETPMANLFVSVLRRAGSQQERFGDSTGALDVG